ncbi:MAG: CoA transferase [Candidatus Tectomicrobia bacterium]|nr:CoA transferase [Candidatus Tectomicrobia bacterium]
MTYPLSGLKVLDLTHLIAGPYCTKLLSEFGAEVVKIEKPGEGDLARRIGPFLNDIPHFERSGLFLYLNMGKKSITLNLRTVKGKKILFELVKWADVVVENFEPRVMPDLELAYEVLEKINPKVVMTSISNFGQTGPYRDYLADEIIEQAMSGLMYIVGDPTGEPLKPGGFQAEYQAGLSGAIGTMTALYARNRTGRGEHVDISIMETITSLIENTLVVYSYQGVVRKRAGSRFPRNHPTAILPCKDGYIAVAAQMQKQWEALCELIEKPDLLDDPKFATAADRYDHADEIDEVLLIWSRELTKEEIFHRAQARRIPVSIVCTVQDLLNDPHYQARNFFIELGHPEAGSLTYPGAPFKMSETEWKGARAPLLGEHNQEIYGDLLGYTQQDLEKLRSTKVI